MCWRPLRIACARLLIIARPCPVQIRAERPLEAQQRCRLRSHRRYADRRSEFCVAGELWDSLQQRLCAPEMPTAAWPGLRQDSSARAGCANGSTVHTQLHTVSCPSSALRITASAATYERLHTGLLHYEPDSQTSGSSRPTTDHSPIAGAPVLGARSIKFFHVWPSLAIAPQAGRWIVASELFETSLCSRGRWPTHQEPRRKGWIRPGGTCLKRSSRSHWEKRAGQVVAFRAPTLYGPARFISQRRVNYGPIDPSPRATLSFGDGAGPRPLDTRPLSWPQPYAESAEIRELESQGDATRCAGRLGLIFASRSRPRPGFGYTGPNSSAGAPSRARRCAAAVSFARGAIPARVTGVTRRCNPKSIAMGGLDMALSSTSNPAPA